MRILRCLAILAFFTLTACENMQIGPVRSDPTSASQVSLPGVQTTSTPFQPDENQQVHIHFSPGVPEEWVTLAEGINGVTLTDDATNADISIAQQAIANGFTSVFTSEVVFAAAVPFFTVRDEVDLVLISNLWAGKARQDEYTCLLVSPRTEGILSETWGQPGPTTLVLPGDEIVATLEADPACMAIVPFEDITPRMKILKLDGQSPLEKPLDRTRYPLIVHFAMALRDGATGGIRATAIELVQKLPATNRDEYRMTVIVMSGTTALVRATAAKIRDKGQEYPIDLVREWFLKADLRHVSNEVSFMEGCPDPDPYSTSLQFCSDPANIGVLEKLGVNVVELTGNHVNDYGPKNLAATIRMYKERN